MTFPFPIVSPYLPPAEVSYTAQASNESNLTTYTFSTLSFGAADSGRFMVVGVYAAANSDFGNITGVTIGGVTATQLVQIEDALGDSDFAFYGASVPTGTTGDVVVTLNAAPDRCGVAVFRVVKLLSTTPTAATGANTGSAPVSANIATTSKGILIGFAGIENNASTWTWTNMTEQVDTAVGSGGTSMTGASDNISVGSASLSVTATPSSPASRQGLLLVAMR